MDSFCETEERKLGVVEGVQAYKWFTIEVEGRDCHTGTTDFKNRADALLTASKMIVLSHRIATAHNALASTGIVSLKPGSTNTVPGYVRFSLDIRAPKDETVEVVEKQIKQDFQRIAAGEDVSGLSDGGTKGRPCSVQWTTDSISPAVRFHNDCIQCVTEASKGLFGSDSERLTKRMTSGAGHDSVHTSKKCPTTMVFIPCRDGVSHNPAEYSTPEDCAIGASVLMGAILRYDRLRAQQEHQGSLG